MDFISYAQNLEDVMLWRALRHVERGFYIDVGASHPDIDSITRAFYERGWRGINIEPAPEPFARLQSDRPGDLNLQLAVAETAGSAPFYNIGGGDGLSTLDPSLAQVHAAQGFALRLDQTPTERLAVICERHVRGSIHFLKIDAEGAEEAVLRSGDFNRWRPWIVLVEATFPNSQEPTHAAWEPILLHAQYRFAYFDGLNRFYVAEEWCDALIPAFAAPPNVFDTYLRDREHQAQCSARRSEQLANDIEDQRATLERAAFEQHRTLAGELDVLRGRIADLNAAAAAHSADQAACSQQLAAAAHTIEHRNRHMERLEAQHAATRSQLDAAEHRAAALARQGAALREQAVAAARAHDGAVALNTTLRHSMAAEIARLTAQNDVLAAGLRRAGQDCDAALTILRSRHSALELELSKLYASTSWRISAPLRWVKYAALALTGR